MTRASIASRLHAAISRLGLASEARDWAAIAAEDRNLRALASELAAQAKWKAAEYRALTSAKATVHAALERIDEERRRVAKKIADFNLHRSAWIAYAMHEDVEARRQ